MHIENFENNHCVAKDNVETKPIFILGVQRSGTTLLSFILDSHPNIAVGRETMVMRAMHYLFGDDAKENSLLLVRNWFERYGMSRKDFAAYVRRFLNDFFYDYAVRQGKKRWGEKTPWHTYYHDLIYEIFPNAQFIHIVRDPRAVCTSRMSWPGTIESFAKEWQEQNEKLVNFGKRLPRAQYQRVRYEDLVSEPRKTMRGLISFLGEEWSDQMLCHEKIVSQRFVVGDKGEEINPILRTNHDGKAVVEGGFMNSPERAIDTKSIDLWKTKLRKIYIWKIQKIAQKGMDIFGYKRAKGLVPLVGRLKLEP